MNSELWYTSKKLSSNLIYICDNKYDSIYLILGKDQAVLIDTGLGIYDLNQYISNLVSTKITVFNTHGHIDHCSGNYFFENTYIHPNDRSMATTRFIPSTIDFIYRTFKKVPEPAFFNYNRWILRSQSVTNISEQPYDFGDFILHPIFTPGHTKGSVCFFIEPYNILFTGDNIVHGPTWLQLPESADINEFYISIQKLIPYINDSTLIYSGHSKRPVSSAIVHKLPSFLEKVINEEIEPLPRKTLVGHTLHYQFEKHYGVLISK